MRDLNTLEARVEAACDAIHNKIDDVLVESFPEVTTGDVSFDEPFPQALRDFVTRWYQNNAPMA